MKHKIVNDEQFEFWNEGIGRKWVEEDNSMNERLSILTKELFLRSNIKRDDKILDIGCGGGQTTFDASEMVGENGYVVGADISKILLDLFISAISSHNSSTDSILWVEKITVAPCLRNSKISSFIRFALIGSNPENGSSKINNLGLCKTVTMN